MIKRILNLINKQQLKYWKRQITSLEFEIEYANNPESEINKMMIEYKRYERIIKGLELLLEYDKNNRTQCYCTKCQNELISSGSFIKDDDFVYYKCTECGAESKWLFDAPVPILITEDLV